MKNFIFSLALCSFASLLAGCADAPVDHTQLADATAKPVCQQADTATGSIAVRRTCRASLSDDERSELNNQLHGQNPASAQPTTFSSSPRH